MGKKFKKKDGGGGGFQKRKKLEIVFDPEARKEYLTGFSKRKKERRKFGLAMQKVKNRKAKLAEREEIRQAKKEALPDFPEVLEQEKEPEEIEPAQVLEFADNFTTSHFGDSVTVTTFLGIPQAEEDDADERYERARRPHNPNGVDQAQIAAGSVERFKKMLAGNLPSLKRKKTKENTSGSFNPKKLKDKEDGDDAGGKKGKKGKKGKR